MLSAFFRYRNAAAERFVGPAETNLVSAGVIVWGTRFYAQDQNLARAQVKAFRDFGRQRVAARIHRDLHDRPESDGRENVYVAVQIPAAQSNQQIARHALERIEVPRQSWVTQVQRRNPSVDFV